MLKIKAIMAGLLCTIALNASALCVYNKTDQSVFFYSDQDIITNQPKELPAGTRHCTHPGETGFGYAIMDSKDENGQIICAALWTNVNAQIVNVINKDEMYSTCEIS